MKSFLSTVQMIQRNQKAVKQAKWARTSYYLELFRFLVKSSLETCQLKHKMESEMSIPLLTLSCIGAEEERPSAAKVMVHVREEDLSTVDRILFGDWKELEIIGFVEV